MFAKNKECCATFWFIQLKAINWASSPFKKENPSSKKKYDPIFGLYRSCPTIGKIGRLIYYNLILKKYIKIQRKYRFNVFLMNNKVLLHGARERMNIWDSSFEFGTFRIFIH